MSGAASGFNEDANNRQLHPNETMILDRLYNSTKNKDKQTRLVKAACSITHCAAGVPKSDPKYAELSALQKQGARYTTEINQLKNAGFGSYTGMDAQNDRLTQYGVNLNRSTGTTQGQAVIGSINGKGYQAKPSIKTDAQLLNADKNTLSIAENTRRGNLIQQQRHAEELKGTGQGWASSTSFEGYPVLYTTGQALIGLPKGAGNFIPNMGNGLINTAALVTGTTSPYNFSPWTPYSNTVQAQSGEVVQRVIGVALVAGGSALGGAGAEAGRVVTTGGANSAASFSLLQESQLLARQTAQDLQNGVLPGVLEDGKVLGNPRAMPPSYNASATAENTALQYLGRAPTVAEREAGERMVGGNCVGCWRATKADGTVVVYRPAGASTNSAESTATVEIGKNAEIRVLNGGEKKVLKLKFPELGTSR